MIKRSAGILVYKKVNNQIKVLLCHFGGPYWKEKDIGAWSLPKGELSQGEPAIDAARREFMEETNLVCDSELEYLGSTKVSHRKIAIMFFVESDFDLSNCKSNTFKLESPKGSGKYREFPEMDKYEWMELKKAKEMIIPNQLYFLKRLESRLE